MGPPKKEADQRASCSRFYVAQNGDAISLMFYHWLSNGNSATADAVGEGRPTLYNYYLGLGKYRIQHEFYYIIYMYSFI